MAASKARVVVLYTWRRMAAPDTAFPLIRLLLTPWTDE